MFQVGTPTRLAYQYVDDNGDPTDGGDVTVSITLPDGTTATAAVSTDGIGSYWLDYTPTQSGLHAWHFVSTLLGNSPVDTFVAGSLTTGALVSLSEAKQQLGISGNGKDLELLGFIHAATGIVNRRCGYSAPTTFTEVIEGRADSSGRTILALGRTPVLSVTSITTQLQGLPQIDITSLVINNDAGLVYLGNWFAWYGPVSVTYVAGRSTVPNSLKTACLILVRWLWDTRRAGATAIPNQGGDETLNVDGLELPARAVALMDMAPYMAAPGIA